jgi:hypothetical protein
LHAPDIAPHPGLIWPPLKAWQARVRKKLLPTLPSPETCQQRLAADEALVQPFFDAATGAFYALWLTQEAFELRPFSAASAWAHWQHKVLSRWEAWLDKEHSRGLITLLPELATSAPMQEFTETLTAWAQSARAQRLSIVFPARLGQLPAFEHRVPGPTGTVALGGPRAV